MKSLKILVKYQHFSINPLWTHPQGHPNLEVYLSQVENKLSSIADEPIRYSNLSKEDWIAMGSLADDRSIIIKKANKGSCIVVSDRNNYLTEAEKQLEDQNVYRKIAFMDKILSQLVDCTNKFFKNLKMKDHITEKELKYFSYEFKKSCNLQKLYLLPKIQEVSKTFLVDQWFLTLACNWEDVRISWSPS